MYDQEKKKTRGKVFRCKLNDNQISNNHQVVHFTVDIIYF